MKTHTFLFTLLFLTSGIMVNGQTREKKDYLWSFQGKNRTHTLGLYGGLYGSYSMVNADPVGFLGYRTGIVLDKKLGAGLSGSALWYDQALNGLHQIGTCHLQAGYTGLYVEYIKSFGNNVKLDFSVLSGAGIIRYQLDKDYTSGLFWYEEIIDQDNFTVFEPGIECQTRIGGNWWLGAFATYRTTSPVELYAAADDLLKNYTAGISIKFGVF